MHLFKKKLEKSPYNVMALKIASENTIEKQAFISLQSSIEKKYLLAQDSGI